MAGGLCDICTVHASIRWTSELLVWDNGVYGHGKSQEAGWQWDGLCRTRYVESLIPELFYTRKSQEPKSYITSHLRRTHRLTAR